MKSLALDEFKDNRCFFYLHLDLKDTEQVIGRARL